MSDFLVKHKIFVVLVVALLTLLAETFVMNMVNNESGAAYSRSLYGKIDCYWYNGKTMGHCEDYTAQTGTTVGSVGEITLQYIQGSGLLSSYENTNYLFMETNESIPTGTTGYSASMSMNNVPPSAQFQLTATPIDGFGVWVGNNYSTSQTGIPTPATPSFSPNAFYIGYDLAVQCSGGYYLSLAANNTTWLFCAYFVPKVYNITFSGGYGAWADATSASTTWQYLEIFPTINNPYLAKYNFYGWYISLTSGSYVSPDSDYYYWISKQTLATSIYGGYFKQTANIDLIDMIWQPIGSTSRYFIGNYDGNGYAITGIQTAWYTDASDSFLYNYQGVFGYVNNSSISNVNVLGGTISGKEYVGGIVGYARNATISNCQTNVTISASNYCGGIAGYGNSSRIQRCYSNAYITASTNTGGILGYSYSTNTEVNSCGFNGYLAFSKAMIMVGGGKAIIIDCFGISQGTNAFAPTDSASYISSSLYISGNRKYYYQMGSFSNWIIPTWVTNSTLDRTPIPKALFWIAGSGTAVSSYNDLTRLGYKKV